MPVIGGCYTAKLTLLLPAVSSLSLDYLPLLFSLCQFPCYSTSLPELHTYSRDRDMYIRAWAHFWKRVCIAEPFSSSLLLLVLSTPITPPPGSIRTSGYRADTLHACWVSLEKILGNWWGGLFPNLSNNNFAGGIRYVKGNYRGWNIAISFRYWIKKYIRLEYIIFGERDSKIYFCDYI